MTTLYPFQERVDVLLRAGRNVILQAPTGTGKTRAALFPFLDAWRGDPSLFPRQCMYVVPLRALANQFEREYKEIVQRFTTSRGLREVGAVSIQTGARPADARFEADLIFTTLDQMLSSVLTIPYGLSNRQANLNAGAIVGSYLVFDEFHLFPVDENGNGALATTLHILKMLKGVTPFVLMTATFSKKMLAELCYELDAEAVTLSDEEITAIPSQQGKQRLYRYTRQQLTATAVAEDFVRHNRHRVIAVCNTVDRAQSLAAQLRADSSLAGAHVELLHSRFFQSDRAAKEEMVAREFGEDRSQYSLEPMILVATQVIEVGLNLTCEVLHTELAPANALVQRAGRCARFAGESGTVLVHNVPLRDDGTPNYAPYIDRRSKKSEDDEAEGQSAICERTRDTLAELPADGAALAYHDELDLVNKAHEPFDERLLDRLGENQVHLQQTIQHVLLDRDRSASRELIRDIDSRAVLIHHNPTTETLPNPLGYESISLQKTTLIGWFTRVQEQAIARELDWVAKIGVAKESADGGSESAEREVHVVWEWLSLCPSTNKADIRAGQQALASSTIVVLNPALVQYDAALGLQLDSSNSTLAPDSPKAVSRSRADKQHGPIELETYEQHIQGLYRVYTSRLRDQTAAVRHRLEQRHGLEDHLIDRAIRLMFAVHDLGKLDQTWQQWAHKWQAKVCELRGTDRYIPESYMAAHTDYDSSSPVERRESAKIRPKRPYHAAESAQAGSEFLRALAGDCEALYYALMTAIVCHHSAALDRTGHGQFRPVSKAAKQAFNDAMRAVHMIDDPKLLAAIKRGQRIDWNGFPAAEALSDATIRLDRPAQIILYLLFVRVLRLADQGSQDKSG